jgi:putative oxidoreductase
MRRAWSQWAPLPLRLVLGFAFMYHGWPKLFTAAGHAGFAANLQGMGIPAPAVASWALAALEVFGGLALLVGAFTTVMAALLVIHQLFAMFLVHWSSGFSFIHVTGMTATGPQFGMPGYEVNLLFIAGLLTLLLGGAGVLSVDAARQKPAGVL